MPATYKQAMEAATQWSVAVLRCRTRGHSWEQDTRHPDAGRYGREHHVYFWCTRECGVTKQEVWNQRGVILKSKLSYPKSADGEQAYLSDVGFIDREGRGALRLATLEAAS